jgi:hypothetical protein
MGPDGTAAGAPTFRSLVHADIPVLTANHIGSGALHVDRIPSIDIVSKTSGNLTVARGGTGATTAAAACTNIGAVPTTRTINTKPLTANVTLDTGDIQMLSFATMPAVTPKNVFFRVGKRTFFDTGAA